MALTRVSRHIIDEPLELQNINATGIGTFASLRVTGDLQVDGTTTTLDTVVTEVDRLEVAANNSTVGVAITQTGSGDILRLYDGTTQAVTVEDGGNVGLGIANPAYLLHLQRYGNTEIVLNNTRGSSTGGFAAYDDHIEVSAITNDPLLLKTNNIERLRIDSDGKIVTSGGAAVGTVTLAGDGKDMVFGRTQNSGTGGVGRLVATGNIVYLQAGANTSSGSAADLVFGNYGGVGERLRITSDGKVRVPDNGKFTCGASDDLQIYHTGSHSLIDESGTGNLVIRSNLISFEKYTNEQLARFTADGSCEFYYDNSKKLETTTNGIQVTGQIDIGTTSIYSTGDISMGDSDQLRLGGGDDLRIYHDGSVNRIRSDVLTVIEKNDSEDMASFMPDGAVVLFHNGSQKFTTTSDGATITGELGFASGGTYQLKLSDNQKIRFGGANDLQIYHDGANSYVSDVGTGDLRLSGNVVKFNNHNNTATMVKATEGDSVELNYDNSKKFETTTTGAKVTGALEVTQEYPSIRPTLDLNFAATKTLDRRITFTRDGIGTYIDENGLVKYASNNVPRFDHDFDTRESLGLLIEESRTNKFTYSTTIGGTGWNKQGTAADYITNTTEVAAPDGTFTALKWNPSSIPQYLYQNLSNIGTTQSTMSVWVRCPAGQSRTFFMNLYSPTQNGGAGQFTATDQWQRFTWTFTPQSQSNVYPIVPDSAGIYYIWGPQLEEGTFATSYIPTSGSTVTRGADNVTIKGTNFTDFYNSTEGTLVTEHMGGGDANMSPYVALLSDGTNNERIIIMSDYAGYQVVVKEGNVNQAVLDGGTPILNVKNKNATALKKDDFALSLNGGTVATDTSGNMSVVDQLWIGSRNGADSYMNNTIQSIKYYNKRLPNAQLQGLTQQ